MLTGTRTIAGTRSKWAAGEEEDGRERRVESGEFGVGGKIGKKIDGDASHFYFWRVKLR